jgi:hypothetical protein
MEKSVHRIDCSYHGCWVLGPIPKAIVYVGESISSEDS